MADIVSSCPGRRELQSDQSGACLLQRPVPSRTTVLDFQIETSYGDCAEDTAD